MWEMKPSPTSISLMMFRMLEIVVLALEILHEESSQLGLEINWTKTKTQVFDEDINQPSKVSVLGHDVEVVDSFSRLSILDRALCREFINKTIVLIRQSLYYNHV